MAEVEGDKLIDETPLNLSDKDLKQQMFKEYDNNKR